MPHSLCQWLAYGLVVIVGAIVSFGIQWLVMSVILEPVGIVRKTREKMKRLQECLTGEAVVEQKDTPYEDLGTRLSALVGTLEIVLYASCVVFDHPEFIAVWFATKYVAAFKSWGEEPVGRTFYYRSLFGSGLNILLGFFTGRVALWGIYRVSHH
jgi:hypothetical protein